MVYSVAQLIGFLRNFAGPSIPYVNFSLLAYRDVCKTHNWYPNINELTVMEVSNFFFYCQWIVDNL